MKAQTLWRISIATTTEAEEAAAELLATHFALNPSTYTDVETGVTVVSVYAPKRPNNEAATKAALRLGLSEFKRCGLRVGAGRIHMIRLPRDNWADSWKRHFSAFEVGRELLVKPSWIKRQPRPGQKLVVLDPGLSFGTGQHPTTSFCLREIARLAPRQAARSFLDVA